MHYFIAERKNKSVTRCTDWSGFQWYGGIARTTWHGPGIDQMEGQISILKRAEHKGRDTGGSVLAHHRHHRARFACCATLLLAALGASEAQAESKGRGPPSFSPGIGPPAFSSAFGSPAPGL